MGSDKRSRWKQTGAGGALMEAGRSGGCPSGSGWKQAGAGGAALLEEKKLRSRGRLPAAGQAERRRWGYSSCTGQSLARPCCTPAAVILMQHSCCYTYIAALMLLHLYCCTPAAVILLLHLHSYCCAAALLLLGFTAPLEN